MSEKKGCVCVWVVSEGEGEGQTGRDTESADLNVRLNNVIGKLNIPI